MNQNSSAIPKWEVRVRIVLELGILASSLYNIFFGDVATGALMLVTLAIIAFPNFFSRGIVKRIPIEIEIILFIMVVMQMILGGIHDFYTEIPYYDKFVHFMLPMFVGLIGFLAAYMMYATGRLKASAAWVVVVVVLFSLGVGGVWEIMEYSSDRILYPRIEGWHHFQGNAEQDALDDTMTDLIDDTLGGIFGAVLGLYFISRAAQRNSARLSGFVEELSTGLYGRSKNSKLIKKKTSKSKKKRKN